MAYDRRFKRFREFVEDAGAAVGGAPANSAGAGNIAGLGVPAGSKFGEPGGRNPLGGYTSGKKRKHYKEWDQTPNPIEGGERLTELTDAEIEKAAKQVHDTWVANQKKDGKTEHKSPDGKEDYMVPYDKLKEKSKDMDRDAVLATVDALGLDEETKSAFTYKGVRVVWRDKLDLWKANVNGDWLYGEDEAYIKQKIDKAIAGQISKLFVKEAKDEHKDDELETCLACNGTGEDWGETCVTCGGAGKYWISKKTGRFVDYALNEERETFAGSPVFEVDTDKWMKSRFGKNRYHRYSRYVGEDEQGEEIRQHGRSKRKDDIILKDQTTGAMTYFLRRKKAGQ